MRQGGGEQHGEGHFHFTVLSSEYTRVGPGTVEVGLFRLHLILGELADHIEIETRDGDGQAASDLPDHVEAEAQSRDQDQEDAASLGVVQEAAVVGDQDRDLLEVRLCRTERVRGGCGAWRG